MLNIIQRQFPDIPSGQKPKLNRPVQEVAIVPNHFADQALDPISSGSRLDVASDQDSMCEIIGRLPDAHKKLPDFPAAALQQALDIGSPSQTKPSGKFISFDQH
ncbi:MAG: hypothetical protein ABIE70_02015 [bacterium]